MHTGEVKIKKSLEYLQHFLRICTLSFFAIILGLRRRKPTVQIYLVTWLFIGYFKAIPQR